MTDYYFSTIDETSTVCGFRLEELVLFANACRRQGIDETDLKMFANNCGMAYDFIADLFKESLHEELERIMNESNSSN